MVAVLAEEMGLLGVLWVILLVMALVLAALAIGQRAVRSNQLFAGYLAYGLALWLGTQALINVGVNVGLLPTKGLTLPLVSYGGSSLVVSLVVVSLLLRIAVEASPRDFRSATNHGAIANGTGFADGMARASHDVPGYVTSKAIGLTLGRVH